MKKHSKILKLTAIAVVLLMLITCFASCAGSSVASDASGTHGSLAWEYKKDGQTLTVTGVGAMDNFASAADVAWNSVRTSVKKVVVGDGITTVADHAFYYMPSLEEVVLPASLTSIGAHSFAFSSKLARIDIPTGVSSIGRGAFESSGLTSISLPAATVSLGERAFAYCTSLTTVAIYGNLNSIESKTFQNCSKLETLNVSAEFSADATKVIAPDAFEGASRDLSSAGKVNADGSSTVTVYYVDTEGVTVAEKQSQQVAYGQSYSLISPPVEGYTADKLSVVGVANGTDVTYTVVYSKVEVQPEAPAQTEPETEAPAEEDEGLTPANIIAIVVMAVVLIGIAVGAFLLMRSDKKKPAAKGAGKSGSGKNKRSGR